MGRKKSGIIGLILALIYIVYNIFISVEVSSGFPVQEFLGELFSVAQVGLIIIVPALILIFTKSFKKDVNWIGWLYVATLVLSSMFFIYSNIFIRDPLAAGLPMLLIAMPLLIIISLLLLINKKW